MEWVEKMNRAIDYIEDHLEDRVDYEKVAQIACCSVFLFQRMFSFLTDVSLSEYIRRRRMSLAAIELKNSDIKVIDLALKYGYESPEAFTRAFQTFHGISPALARRYGVDLKDYNRISFQITIKGGISMGSKTLIRNVLPYPVGCETRRYIACFISALMCIEKMDADYEPYLCPNESQPAFGSKCINCGKCGDENRPKTLEGMHEELYHLYLTVSGIGLLAFNNDLDTYSSEQDRMVDSVIDDYIDATMNYAGYKYERFTNMDSKTNVYRKIKGSIDMGWPVIMNLKSVKSGTNYVVVTGYNDESETIFGFDGKDTYLGTELEADGYTGDNMFHMKKWYENMLFALIFTGKVQPSIQWRQACMRSISIVEKQRRMGYGEALFKLLGNDGYFDTVDIDELRRIYGFVDAYCGFLAEQRCFVGYCLETAFCKAVENPDVRRHMLEIAKTCFESHDTAWDAWRGIGCWQDTDNTEMLRKADVRKKVTEDFRMIFQNDLKVAEGLKQCVELA